MAQLVKNLPEMQETWVRSLGWEDPLEKGKVTHSCILAWRIPWTDCQWMNSKSSRLRLFATLWTVESMEFSRPEYWSG